MPPPLADAEFPEMVELVTVTVEELVLKMPPPEIPAVLPDMVELMTVRMLRL